VAALTKHPRAVGVLEFHRMVIERLAVVLAFTDFAAAHAVGLDRIGILEPVDHIQIVDVLLANVVAADPGEVVPVAKLISFR
jgi:Ni,Fe-hydrogenase maturation factor